MWKHKKKLRSSRSRLLNYITTISCHNDESAAVVVAEDVSSSSLLLLLSAAGHNASKWAPIECLTATRNWINCMPRCHIFSCTTWCVCRSACSISSSDARSSRVFHPCYLVPPFPLPRFQRPRYRDFLPRTLMNYSTRTSTSQWKSRWKTGSHLWRNAISQLIALFQATRLIDKNKEIEKPQIE